MKRLLILKKMAYWLEDEKVIFSFTNKHDNVNKFIQENYNEIDEILYSEEYDTLNGEIAKIGEMK